MGTQMRLIGLAVVLTCSTCATAGGDKSVIGTYWVRYQPIQVSGTLKGCQLNFMATTSDRTYRDGDIIAVNGSIVIRDYDKGPASTVLVLKVGLKDMTQQSSYERPAFSYLQTKTASTARAPQVAVDGDPGYKLFEYRVADSSVVGVLKEMMIARRVTIGFSRRKGGMDVLVPLDLMVTDTEFTETQEVMRKTSPDAALGRLQCVGDVLKGVTAKHN